MLCDNMARPRSEINITCQNPSCNYCLVEKGKDIVKRGENKAGNQQYFCNHCRVWFVETANTPLYHKHIKLPEIVYICYLLSCNDSIRSIAKVINRDRNTICHLLDNLVVNPDYINNVFPELLNQSDINQIWYAILRRKKNVSEETRSKIMKLMYEPRENN